MERKERMKRYLCNILVILALAAVLPACSTAQNLETASPSPDVTPTAAPTPTPTPFTITESWFDDALFLGDSEVGALNIYNIREQGLGEAIIAYRNGYSCYNAIRKGDKIFFTGRQLNIEDAVSISEAKKVFLLFSANDLAFPLEDVEECWDEMLDRISDKCPETDIYVQSAPPINREATYFNNENVQSYNEMLQRVCEKHGCCYVDITNGLTDENGDTYKGYYVDFVHFSTEGCKVWVKNLMDVSSYSIPPTE